MLFGVHVFATESSFQPDELAVAAEERGLESVWFSEHTHIPKTFLEEQGAESPLPDYYWQTYDPFVAMTLAAAATSKINVGSGATLAVQRDPIILAKETATLDHISGGRLVMGVGAGWLEPEMSDHGVVYRTRYRRLKEHIAAIKEIWTTEVSEYHGEFVDFDGMLAFPKPHQRPHPPIIMCGGGGKSIECAVEICEGWGPVELEWPTARERLADLRRRAEAIGRDPASIEVTLFQGQMPDERTMDEMETAGVNRIVLSIKGRSSNEALPTLDILAEASR